jgi:Pentapeptide repeats (8 copies)
MRLSYRLALWLATALVGLASAAAAAYVVVEVVFEVLPDRYARQGQSRSDVSTLAVQLLGGLLLLAGAVFTARTYWLSRGGQIAERYGSAIGQLGSKSREVRLGGIYALERIARDSRYDHVRVVEVLTAYVRERAEWREGSTEPDPDKGGGSEAAAVRQTEADEWRPGRPPIAVQAVIAVLGRRNARHDEHKLDLTSTDLRDVKFGKGNFKNAILVSANLERADLAGAKLNRAELDRAILRKANLRGCQLQKATLKGADLDEATYDLNTKWPAGFNFVGAGAVEHDEHS